MKNIKDIPFAEITAFLMIMMFAIGMGVFIADFFNDLKNKTHEAEFMNIPMISSAFLFLLTGIIKTIKPD